MQTYFVAEKNLEGWSLKKAQEKQEQWLYYHNNIRKQSHHAAVRQVLLLALHLHLFTYFLQQWHYEVYVIIPILQMRKLRQR